jgi:hypothetical protein
LGHQGRKIAAGGMRLGNLDLLEDELEVVLDDLNYRDVPLWRTHS